MARRVRVAERFAVLSDVHSNLQALSAVLEDLRRFGIERVRCLGDVVGYGGNPKEVIDICREFEFTVLGNHDDAVALDAPEEFHPAAARAIRWTRRRLRPGRFAATPVLRRWTYLRRRLSRTVRLGNLLFAHGTTDSHFEYVDDIGTAAEVLERRPRGVDTVFVGHTHVPGVYACTGRGLEWFGTNGSATHRDFPRIGSCPMIVNPGSVGQPRDGDPRASYLVVAGDRLMVRRVAYDVDGAARAIYRHRLLPRQFGDRLYEGM